MTKNPSTQSKQPTKIDSIKLTRTIKDQIIDDLIATNITPKLGYLQRRNELLVAEITQSKLHEYSQEEQDWILSAPRGALDTVEFVRISVTNTRAEDPMYSCTHIAHNLTPNFEGGPDWYQLPYPIEVLPHRAHDFELMYISSDTPFGKRALDNYKEAIRLMNLQEKVVNTPNDVLRSCTTIKQVKDKHPELIDYIPESASSSHNANSKNSLGKTKINEARIKSLFKQLIP